MGRGTLFLVAGEVQEVVEELREKIVNKSPNGHTCLRFFVDEEGLKR